MRIDSYSFGRMVVEGKEYRADLILDNNDVRPNWWREEGHKLQLEDIREVLDAVKPEVLVVGKGKFGMMRVAPELERFLEERGIELRAANTGRAVQEFNQLAGKKRVVGAFHLTC